VRLECESCRELVVGSFEVDGGALRATCPACRHVMTAQLAQAPPVDDAQLCPKCGAPRRSELAACAGCGLAADRMAAFTEAREAAVPEVVREAWLRATARWHEPAVHDELLQLAAAHNCYAWVAGRYRTRGADAVAQRQLDRLRRTAEATLLASATARQQATARPYRATRSVLAILIVAVLVGLLYAMVIRERPRPRTPSIPGRPSGSVRTLTPGHPVSPSTIR
jgi:hypothetical protein